LLFIVLVFYYHVLQGQAGPTEILSHGSFFHVQQSGDLGKRFVVDMPELDDGLLQWRQLVDELDQLTDRVVVFFLLCTVMSFQRCSRHLLPEHIHAVMAQQDDSQTAHGFPDIAHHLPQSFQYCLHGVLTVGDVVQIAFCCTEQHGTEPYGFLLELFFCHQMKSSFLLFIYNTEKKAVCDMKDKEIYSTIKKF
jgi:hypothetical protein